MVATMPINSYGDCSKNECALSVSAVMHASTVKAFFSNKMAVECKIPPPFRLIRRVSAGTPVIVPVVEWPRMEMHAVEARGHLDITCTGPVKQPNGHLGSRVTVAFMVLYQSGPVM